MEEHISRDVPLPVTGREESAGSASANPVRVENVRRPNKTRARIVQIVSLVLLVLALVLLWRFLGDRAATTGAGRGGRGGGG
jgi:hypothetical protein